MRGLLWFWRLIAQDNLQPAGLEHLIDNLGTFARSVQLHFKVVMETLVHLMVAGDTFAVSCNACHPLLAGEVNVG